MNAVVPLLLILSGPVDIEVSTLDGEAFSGALTEWTSLQVTVGETVVPTDSIHQLEFQPAAVLDEAAPVVVLSDGSRLTVSSVARGAGRYSFEVDGQNVELPAAAVAAVRFDVLQERIAKTWRELVERERRDDLLARIRGESLDYVGCILGDISAETVSLRVGTRDVDAPRSKVFGILHASNNSAQKRLAGRVILADGSELAATQLEWTDARLDVVTGSGLKRSISADAIASVDLAAGRVRMLRDLEPRSVKYEPFGDNYDEFAWQMRKDRNALDQRLRINGQPFETGLWIHSGTVATFGLPPRTQRFQATLGIDELETAGAPVRVELRADGRSIYNEVIQAESPQQVDIDLRDARTLTIVASTTNPGGHGIREHLAVVRARLILE